MGTESPGHASYRWLIITLAVGAGVYAWYAISQYDRLNDLNQRQLSNAAAEVQTAIDIAVVTVDEFDRRWLESADSSRPQRLRLHAEPAVSGTARLRHHR